MRRLVVKREGKIDIKIIIRNCAIMRYLRQHSNAFTMPGLPGQGYRENIECKERELIKVYNEKGRWTK